MTWHRRTALSSKQATAAEKVLDGRPIAFLGQHFEHLGAEIPELRGVSAQLLQGRKSAGAGVVMTGEKQGDLGRVAARRGAVCAVEPGQNNRPAGLVAIQG